MAVLTSDANQQYNGNRLLWIKWKATFFFNGHIEKFGDAKVKVVLRPKKNFVFALDFKTMLTKH